MTTPTGPVEPTEPDTGPVPAADDARATLGVLPAGPVRDSLELLCDYVVDRTG